MMHILKNQISLDLSNEQMIAVVNPPFWSAVNVIQHFLLCWAVRCNSDKCHCFRGGHRWMFHMYVNSSGQSSSWRLGSPCYVSFDDFFSCLFGFWGLSTQGRVIERCRQQKEGYFPSNFHLFFVRLTIKYSLISSSLNKKDINITMTPSQGISK